MLRSTFVSSMLLIAACIAGAALAQSEFKPGSGPPPAPANTAQGSSASGRGRISTRVAVGETAPDFEAVKIDGKPLRLSSTRGTWVMLWFVESRDSLRNVDPVAITLAKAQVRTYAICFDKPQALAQRLRGRELAYVPLADQTGEIVSLYGLMDGTSDSVRPGFVLITPRGDVRIALLGHQLPSADASRLVQLAVLGE